MTQLEQDLLSYLEQFLTQHCGASYEYSLSSHDGIEVYAIRKSDAKDRTCILRVTINHNHQQIYIPTIFIPFDMRYNGLGKILILAIYHLGKIHSYDVFAVQLTDSFRESLLKRGAVTTDVYDTLYITEGTRLQ